MHLFIYFAVFANPFGQYVKPNMKIVLRFATLLREVLCMHRWTTYDLGQGQNKAVFFKMQNEKNFACSTYVERSNLHNIRNIIIMKSSHKYRCLLRKYCADSANTGANKDTALLLRLLRPQPTGSAALESSLPSVTNLRRAFVSKKSSHVCLIDVLQSFLSVCA